MNRLRTTKYYAAASLLLPAAAVLVWKSELWLLAAFILWFAAAAALWIWCERKEHAQRLERTVQAMQSASIRTLNHHRHDWMNELQVLYGYIRMQKTEKTVQCVEQIRERMLNESKIAKLGVSSLINYLQSFRSLTHAVQLETEIEGELALTDLPVNAERIGETVIEILNGYRFGVKPGATGEAAKLSIRFAQEEKALKVELAFDGNLNDVAEWKQRCKRALKGSPLHAANSDYEPQLLTLQADIGN